MSFLSLAHMYQVVRDMYDSPKWREKVKHMSDNQIMAIYFSKEEKDAARKAKRLKSTVQKKLEEVRGRNADEIIELGKVRGILAGCNEVATNCDGSTDDYIPEQLSFFD